MEEHCVYYEAQTALLLFRENSVPQWG